MKKNFFYYASISILAGVCLSLGWYHHYIRHLTSVASSVIPAFDPDETRLEVYIKPLSSDESKKLLGHNLPSKGFQPLHITIQNNSPYEYSISPSSIDMNHIDSKEVAKAIKNSALPRSIAFKILGFFFWPFIIPGTIDTIHTFHTYNLLKKDYKAKSMKDETVPVYSVINRILFVAQEDFKDKFTMTLIETDKQKPEVFDFYTEDPAPEELIATENAPAEEEMQS